MKAKGRLHLMNPRESASWRVRFSLARLRANEVHLFLLVAALCYTFSMPSAESLLFEVLALPVPERAKLVHRLLESLESIPDNDLDDVWLVELEQRARDVQTGTVTAIPWETARGNVLDELRKRRAARLTP